MTQIRIRYNPPPPLPDEVYHGRKQALKPLTHHEILSLMAPFTRRGRHADLQASTRADRRLAFKPIEHGPTEERPVALREVLSLQVPESGPLRLVRTLTEASGLDSSLSAEGPDADQLLTQIESVPIQRQFRMEGEILVARSYEVDSPEDGQPGASGSARTLITGAKARIAGVTLEMKAERFNHHTVELRLTAAPGTKLLIPEDLVAVLGWSWRPVREFVSYWRGGIDVAPKEPRHTADIESKLRRTVLHLARTLDGPPARFHPRHRRARWRVAFQRAIPLSIGLGIVALTPAVQWLDLDDGSILRMLIFHAPPLMLAGLFLLRELPRIEVPPIPRPLTNQAWVAQAAEKDARRGRSPQPPAAADS